MKFIFTSLIFAFFYFFSFGTGSFPEKDGRQDPYSGKASYG